MKNFHQNLLILLALGLCLLCAFQWYGQTLQRNQIDGLNQLLSQKLAAIQDYTNSIRTLDAQISQMDGRISELKGIIRTNDQLLLVQKREINKLETANESLTNQTSQYHQAVDTLEAKLKDAYEGVKRQNESIKELAAQRDEFVQKLNDSVKERNDIVNRYNELVAQVQKMQGGKAAEK